jgi:hypothetical protein
MKVDQLQCFTRGVSFGRGRRAEAYGGCLKIEMVALNMDALDT